MSNSDPSSPPRRTLKLKVPARKPTETHKTPANRGAETRGADKKAELKPGAHWSDEHKRRMQADMDELISRRD